VPTPAPSSCAFGALHRDSLVIDTHVDTATHLLWRSPNFSQHLAEGHVDIPRMREGGLDAAMFAVWIDEGFSDEETLKLCLRGIESVHRTIDAHPDDLAFAQTATVWECASSVHIPVQADGRRVLACAGMTGRNRDSLSQLAVSGAEGKSAASMFSGRVAACCDRTGPRPVVAPPSSSLRNSEGELDTPHQSPRELTRLSRGPGSPAVGARRSGGIMVSERTASTLRYACVRPGPGD